MSLRSFHIVFIAASLGVMAFLAAWAWRLGEAGEPRPGALLCGAAGFAAALGYLAWFLRRCRLPS